MKLRLQQIVLGWMLILAVGGHWPLLQSVAWVNMLVKYSQTDDFRTAVVKTFDGKHPCNICSIVAKGKETEEKRASNFSHSKIDFFLTERETFYLREEPAVITAFTLPEDGCWLSAPLSPPPEPA